MMHLVFVILAFLQFNDYDSSSYEDQLKEILVDSKSTILPNYRYIDGSLKDATYSIINRDGVFQLRGSLLGNTLKVGDLHQGIYYVKTLSAKNQPMSYFLIK